MSSDTNAALTVSTARYGLSIAWLAASEHSRAWSSSASSSSHGSESVSHRTSSAAPTRVCSHEHVHTIEATSSLCGRLVMFEVIEGLVQVRWS